MNKLTNADISSRLGEIYLIQDFCDRYQTLKDFESEYKKSPFYHKTRCPLAQLYRQYVLEHLLSLSSLLHNLQNMVSELDTEKLTAMFDSINEQTASTIMEGTELFDKLGLADLFAAAGKKKA